MRCPPNHSHFFLSWLVSHRLLLFFSSSFASPTFTMDRKLPQDDSLVSLMVPSTHPSIKHQCWLMVDKYMHVHLKAMRVLSADVFSQGMDTHLTEDFWERCSFGHYRNQPHGNSRFRELMFPFNWEPLWEQEPSSICLWNPPWWAYTQCLKSLQKVYFLRVDCLQTANAEFLNHSLALPGHSEYLGKY